MNNRLTLSNPFDSDVVRNPEQVGSVDVAEIHKRSFEACCSEYERVVSAGESGSVLFYGEAGCGKTHLLSRFRRWLRGEMESRPSQPPAGFIAVRMETAPSQVWRHLRRRFVEHVLEPAQGGAAVLDDILVHFAQRYGQGDLGAALDRVETGLTLEAVRVLEHFEAGRHRRVCKAWLKGEPLAEIDSATLGIVSITPEDLDEDSGESLARRFVLSLAKLCQPKPVVFCFDQIEALGLSAGDKSFAPFTRLGASLVDETPNALVVSSVIAQFLTSLEATPADFVRISKRTEDLKPLTWELGRLLVEARLEGEDALKSYRPHGGTEPLAEKDLRAVFDQEYSKCRARKLIHEAKRLFSIWQGTETEPKIPVEQFLESTLEALREKSVIRSQSTEMDEILEHGLSVSAKIAELTMDASSHPGIDFEAGPANARILFSICNQAHAKSVFHKLDRLQKSLDAERIKSLCLVRDPRLTISRTASKTNKALANLMEHGARLVRPDPEAVAAIDAIRLLLSSALSGDLSHDGEPVPEAKVLAWLKANLPSAVSDFIDELRGGTKPLELEPLFDLLKRRKVIAVDEAAQELGWPLSQVIEHARATPNQAGFLEGQTRVVFHVVSSAAGGPNASS